MINTRHTEYSKNNKKKEPTEHWNKNNPQQTDNKERRYETLQGKAY